MTPQGSLGLLTLGASNFILIPFVPAILIILTNCALIWIQCRALAGLMFAGLLLKCKHFSTRLDFADGQRPAGRAACIYMFELNRDGPSQKCVAPRLRCHELSSGGLRKSRVQNGGKKSVTACFSITTRTRKTELPVPPIQYVRSPMRECQRHFAGAKCPTAIRQISRFSACPNDLRKKVIPTQK